MRNLRSIIAVVSAMALLVWAVLTPAQAGRMPSSLGSGALLDIESGDVAAANGTNIFIIDVDGVLITATCTGTGSARECDFTLGSSVVVDGDVLSQSNLPTVIANDGVERTHGTHGDCVQFYDATNDLCVYQVETGGSTDGDTMTMHHAGTPAENATVFEVSRGGTPIAPTARLMKVDEDGDMTLLGTLATADPDVERCWMEHTKIGTNATYSNLWGSGGDVYGTVFARDEHVRVAGRNITLETIDCRYDRDLPVNDYMKTGVKKIEIDASVADGTAVDYAADMTVGTTSTLCEELGTSAADETSCTATPAFDIDAGEGWEYYQESPTAYGTFPTWGNCTYLWCMRY